MESNEALQSPQSRYCKLNVDTAYYKDRSYMIINIACPADNRINVKENGKFNTKF